MRTLCSIVITCGCLILVAPATASAPTVHQARLAIRAYDRADHPSSVRVFDCLRHISTVSCSDTEADVVSYWTFDGTPIRMTITASTTVAIRNSRTKVLSSYATHFTNP